MYFQNNARASDAEGRGTLNSGEPLPVATPVTLFSGFCSRLHAAPPWSPKTGVAGRMLQWNIGLVNQRDDVFLADFSDFPQGLAAIAFALGQMDYGSHFPNE